VQDSDNLNAIGITTVDNQIGIYWPEAHTLQCQVRPRVSSLGPRGELLEGFKKLVDLSFRRLDIIDSDEIPDDL